MSKLIFEYIIDEDEGYCASAIIPGGKLFSEGNTLKELHTHSCLDAKYHVKHLHELDPHQHWIYKILKLN
ncbi:unnamed protein product [Didymodactylos carnosus]|uniref:Uncharacterized protein n=1 Tax=Didymodactylos carnosus TaxID=1234261 RepID=A0A814QDG3_9BILA|nr:unnamed protein product [Didymodactylos carnosus]CAF3882148.1 unnamed protein product [Didymodactylos carnosus]